MFFSNCNCCRFRQCCCRQENRYCNKPENKPCFDKHEDRCEQHEKECACKRPNRPCCHIGDRHLYEDDNRDSKASFGGQEYKNYSYGDYSNSFSEQNKLNRGYEYNNEFENRKQNDCFDKQDNSTDKFNQYNDFNYGNYDKSYTPNWTEDKCCNPTYPNDKHDKYDKHDWNNKCCKPVKYICIPFDKD